jgi:uncharacterized membrane-anchored protein YitT (DUF2179 family)
LQIVIDSKNGEFISEELVKENWTRGNTIHTTDIKEIKGRTNKTSISLIINSRELQDLLYFVKDLDESAFITALPITGVYGDFDSRSTVD